MKNSSEESPMDDTKSNSIDQNLLGYIDHEIDYIRSEIQQPGWSLWATLGGLASLVYLLVDSFDQKQINLVGVFLFYILVDIIYLFLRMALSSKNELGREGRFQSLSLPGGSRLILSSIVSLASIFIAYKWQALIEKQIAYSIIAYYGFTLVIVIIAPLMLNFMKRFELASTPSNSRAINARSIGCVYIPMLFITIYPSWRITNYILRNKQILTAVEIKVALIIFAIVFLLSILARIQTKSPILSSLVEIRRDYFL